MKLRTLFKVTLVLCALAAGAVVLNWRWLYKHRPHDTGRPLLGNDAVRAADLVLIETPGGQVTLRLDRGEWVVAEQQALPADVGRLRTLLRTLELTHMGPGMRVAQDELGRLALLEKHENEDRAEEGVTASMLSLVETRSGRDKSLYQLLIGKRHTPGGGTYVRFPGDRAVHLINADLSLDGNPAHWVRHRILPPSIQERLREIRVQLPHKPAFRLWRGSLSSPWRLDEAPKAPRKERVQALARAVSGLRFERAGAAGAGSPPAGRYPTVEAQVDDGWTVSVVVLPADGKAADGKAADGRPVRVSARLAEGRQAPTGAEPAEDLNASVERRVRRFNHHYGRRRLVIDASAAETLLRGRSAYAAAP